MDDTIATTYTSLENTTSTSTDLTLPFFIGPTCERISRAVYRSTMYRLLILLLVALSLSYAASLPPSVAHPALHDLDAAPIIHFTLARRRGPINATVLPGDVAILPNFAHELEKAESRFNLTKREVKGNKLVRKAKVVGGYGGVGRWMGDVAGEGIW